MVNGVAGTTDAAPSSLAYFNDSRCTSSCVDSMDPLLFTCELSNIIGLRVTLPNNVHEHISLGDDSDIHKFVTLPAGFKPVSLNITEMENFTRHFSLTFSIAHVSLLNGKQIKCDDITPKIAVMAGCRECGKF